MATRTVVPFQSLASDPTWKRRRGWRCEEDWVSGGLTLGGAWAVSSLAAWGIHELHRRLRILLSKDLERNPGPLESPEEEAPMSGIPKEPRTQSQIPKARTPSGFGLITTGHAARGNTATQASTDRRDEKVAVSTDPVESGSIESSASPTSATVKPDTLSSAIPNTGTSTHDAGSTVTVSPRHSKERKGDNGKVTGSVTGMKKKTSTKSNSDSGSGRVHNKTEKKKSQSVTKQNKKRASDESECVSVSVGCVESEGIGGVVGLGQGQGGGKGGDVLGKGDNTKSGVSSKMAEKVLVAGNDSVDYVDVAVVRERVDGSQSEGSSDGNDEMSNVSNALDESVKAMLDISSEIEEILGDSDEGESESKVESEQERKKKDVAESMAHSDKDTNKDDNDKDEGRQDKRKSRQTKRSQARGLVSFVQEEFKSMVGVLKSFTLEMKAGQEEVKKRQDDLTKGQENVRQGQEELKREMKEDIKGLQQNQTEQGKIIQEGKEQIDQVLEKVEDTQKKVEETQDKIEGLRTDIQKTQEEVRKNREDIQELRQEQEKARQETKDSQDQLAEELDRIDSNSRRNNLKFFGIPEEGEGQREDSEGLMVRLLNRYFPEGRWKRGNIEKAQRLGRRREEENSKPRPLLAHFTRAGDARRILAHKKGRAEMREGNMQISADLTRRQQDQLKELRSKGQRGYFFRGTLVIDGQNSRGGRGGGWGGAGGEVGGGAMEEEDLTRDRL